MILEALEPLTIRLDGQVRELVPGRPFELAEAQARKLLQLVPDKVHVQGWRDRQQLLDVEIARTERGSP